MSRNTIQHKCLTGIIIAFAMMLVLPSAIYAQKEFPIPFTDEGNLDYPEDPAIAVLEVPERAETLEELACGIDTALYRSVGSEGQMIYFTLGEELLSEACADTEALVLKVLQISLLGHNFCSRYQDDRLDQGKLGFWIEMPETYAVRTPEEEELTPVLNYEFYKNSLQPDDRELLFSDLPAYRKDAAYLPVSNSEQLIFAVEQGYLPLCSPDSEANVFLQRTIRILSWITADTMTETETYRSIYQYVLLSNRYDYQTLLDIHSRGYDNRVFFLEGSMLDGRAVCDGLCKELVLLARLAGLEAYHVGASGEESGHAYVYVKVDGNWYLSCPTYGSNRYTRKDGTQLEYHSQNYLLTDLDTNMEGWLYDSDAHEDIEEQIRYTEPYDYWTETQVEIQGTFYNFHPETVEDAVAVLEDAWKLHETLQIPVEVELCGKVSVLREAYSIMKERCDDLVYLSGGTFEQQRLQIYVFGG